MIPARPPAPAAGAPALAAGTPGPGAAFREGMRDATAVAVALVPFGLVTGVAAIETGLPWGMAVSMSYLVYAGAAQLAALQLVALGSPLFVILATTVLINLRFTLYSASLAPHLRTARWPLRALLGWATTDHTMAVGMQRFATRPDRGSKVAYYGGVALPIWFGWTGGSTVGVFAGAALPPGWSLEFAVPLVFLTMWVVAMVHGKPPVWVAGAVAVLVAIAAQPLPLNLGLLVAAFAGIAAGMAAARWRPAASRQPSGPPPGEDRR